jgi:hypothetical protein
MNVKLTRPGCEHNDSRSSGTDAWVNKVIIIIMIIMIIKGEQKGKKNGTVCIESRDRISSGNGSVKSKFPMGHGQPLPQDTELLLFNEIVVGSHMHHANRFTCHSQTRHKMNNHIYDNQDANRKSRLLIIISTITYT